MLLEVEVELVDPVVDEFFNLGDCLLVFKSDTFLEFRDDTVPLLVFLRD